jgi:hypothetical protein
MVIDNFNVVRIAITPDEAQPPLVIGADAVLSGPIPGQRVQVVGRRLQEILQRGCRSQRTQLAA